jgi:hypothetical protein
VPGHFTHVYTARRVADLLAADDPPPGWPEASEDDPPAGWNRRRDLGNIMKDWEKFAAVGAVGPDLFYFSQDYNGLPLGPISDELMLSLAVYYYYDYAKEHDWEPLLLILEEVDATFANVIRFLIKLQKIWEDFKETWDQTIGPFVQAADSVLDDLTGGVVSEFKVALSELGTALKLVGEEELFTFADIFTRFDTCVAKGLDEQSFLWSDMTHYRRTSELARNLFVQADKPGGLDGEGDWPTAGGEDDDEDCPDREDADDRVRQFKAFALGWMTHLGIDSAAHPFVNEQSGGPFRLHPQRHHLIENHIDAWHYRQAAADSSGRIEGDEVGANETFPDLSNSAFWYAVQFRPDKPGGCQRPDELPDDPTEAEEAVDKDGVMPMWMANAIAQALIATFYRGKLDVPPPNERWSHPRIYQGSAFQDLIDHNLLKDKVEQITGHGLDRPFQELLDAIAPEPPFRVPEGFPLPWQIRTTYFFMNTFFKLSFWGGWELAKPRRPDVVILPPQKDIDDLLQPPDFSGPSSGDPVEDVCDAIKSFFDWVEHEVEAAVTLAGDLVKMLASPGSYPIRLALYELAMMAWNIVSTTHDILAHTGFVIPHGMQTYPDNGELKIPNEIDIPLITLGGSADAAFRQALGDAIDPLGNLDTNPDLLVDHDVRDRNYPYYTAIAMDGTGAPVKPPDDTVTPKEYRRPWAYPDRSPGPTQGKYFPTPTERYDARLPGGDDQPDGTKLPDTMHLTPGPYPIGTLPDDAFFRTSEPVDQAVRNAYEHARTPRETDWLNDQHLFTEGQPQSPLGDPIPLSIYLIARLANDTGYQTQFNLDSDRAYGYLTWDWIRDHEDRAENDAFGLDYAAPNEWPLLSEEWDGPGAQMQLEYVDPATKEEPR